MKYTKYTALAAVLICCLGCKETNRAKLDAAIEKELSVTDVVDENMSGEQRMEEQKMSGDVKLDNRVYHYEIHRQSCDSLPMVKGDYSVNARFHDNTVSLLVTRDGNRLYGKTFSKRSFSAFVDDDMMSRSILKGLVFDKPIKGGLQFALSVGYPQDEDMYIPLLVKVMTDGTISIEKDPLMDSASDADINLNESGKSDAVPQEADPEV